MINGTDSFPQVMDGLKRLQQHKVEYNILAVITNEMVPYTEDVYNYLKTLGTDYLQFIPCIDSFDSNFHKETLSNSMYLTFLKRLFDIWYSDFLNGRKISIRYFDDIVKIVLGYYPESCTLQGKCINQNVIEADGSVYPCDFYVLDKWKFGNIMVNNFEDFANSNATKQFIEKSTNKNKSCIECKYYKLCRGGCRRNKEPFAEVSEVKTKYCEAIYSFFDYSIERFFTIAGGL